MKNLVLSILALVAISFANPAFATNFGDDHSCSGAGCNTGTVTNNTDNHPVTNTATGGASSTGAITNTNTANGGVGGMGGTGGQGGQGGHGGDADVNIGGGFGTSTLSPSAHSDSDSSVSHSGNSFTDVDTDVDASSRNTNTNVNGNSAKQGQGQGQSQGQEQGQSVDSHDVTTYDAPKIPVNSAAPVFAGACSQGASAQFAGVGGSVASGNPVCDYVAVAGALVAAGDRDAALQVLAKAEDSADWRAIFAKIRGCLTLGML